MLRRLNGRPRRILMTVDAVGGVWQYALRLAEQLAGAGDQLVLAGLGPEPSSEQRNEAEAFAGLSWLKTPPEWLADDEAQLEDLDAELAGLIRDFAIDVVHLNAPAQAAGKPFACPVVAVSHSCVATWFRAVRGTAIAEDWAWQQRRNRQGLAKADISVAPSASHAALLSACYGEVPRLRVVHNAVAPASGSRSRDPVVLAAGRWWDEGKNGAVLDRAAARIAWTVLAAGSTDGPNGQTIGFRNVARLGPIPGGAMLRLIGRCAVFVSPSLYEPFGLAALEAAAAATPLVLSDIPTYRELWDGAALFFPPRDADELAETVNRLIDRPAERHRLGQAALRRSRDFKPERQADAMRMLYDEASAIHAEGR